MTREEIKMWLDSLKKDIGQPQHQALWHYAEALDMAIEALQTDIVWCKDCKYKGKVGDVLVCRIHEISTRTDDYCSRGERSEPQTEERLKRLQACIDCEHTDMCEWCYTRWSKTEPQTERSEE